MSQPKDGRDVKRGAESPTLPSLGCNVAVIFYGEGWPLRPEDRELFHFRVRPACLETGFYDVCGVYHEDYDLMKAPDKAVSKLVGDLQASAALNMQHPDVHVVSQIDRLCVTVIYRYC